ncbi:DNA-binding FadR family transcriptional regulator [Leucobacter exalbidus]|uniref:DNA-binding FadR family transcriptional regulator n=1 Tax=Leucobacter exalbidus TaxID=662960 RepID=A0A940T447_9MICO|nr:FCD domain-containing protein [Leucobacter exalbidus]MBP1326852.1 DNA-binding FadR family transcriptional regulator [Leucobacter exalbidus]
MDSRGSEVAADLTSTLFDAPGAAAATRLSAVDTVRARILLAVEHALITPGTKLPRTPLIASGLEVSEITARRALESLVEDGVLVRRRGRGGGTFVSDSPPQLQDSSVVAYRADEQAIHRLIDQRSLMESAIVFAAAQTATPAQCAVLDSFLDRSEAAESWLEHHLPDREFHLYCAEMSGLPETATYAAYYEALTRYYVPYPMDRMSNSRCEHRALVAAFRANDPAAAVRVTRQHVDALRREMFFGLSRPAAAAGDSRS